MGSVDRPGDERQALSAALPIVGVSCSIITPVAGIRHHAVFEAYVQAVSGVCGAIPVLTPALRSLEEPGLGALLERLDGLLLTGSPSMIQPGLYGGAPSADGTLHDPDRDDAVLRLIPRALDLGVPLLAICRGLQELNCALGGSLHQALHAEAGRLDHRAPKTSRTLGEKYLPAHAVRLACGGWLEQLARRAGVPTSEVQVNSLHQQGIARLGGGLEVEATAPDGLVEAVRVAGATSFAFGVQWHPEWHVEDNPLNREILRAFGRACAERSTRRRRTHPAAGALEVA